MLRSVLTAASVLVSSPLLADCPVTIADGPIELTRTAPFFSVVMERTGPDLSEARVMVRDARPETVSTRYGHPLLVIERFAVSGSLSLDYLAAVEDVARLDRALVWRSRVMLRSNGRAVVQGEIALQYRQTEDLRIGACIYEVWVVEEALMLDDRAPIRSVKRFAPDLGLVLNVIQLTPDGAFRSEVGFDRIRHAPGI